MKRKVLHLERKFTSPTETFIVNQINTTARYDQLVFTMKNLHNLKVDAMIVESPGKERFWHSWFLPFQAKKAFKKKYASIRPDIIHSHFLTDARYFHRLTKTCNVPKVCSCYGYDVSRFPKQFGIFARWYFQLTFKEYDYFLAMSSDMKNDLVMLGCPESKVLIHYHGIPTNNFKGKRNFDCGNLFNILTIGSLVPKKGHAIVLKAIKWIRDTHPEINLKYTIVGKGPLQSKLEKFAHDNSIEDMISFKGSVPHGNEFNSILYEADIFVHHSLTSPEGDKEGIPGAIVEAMASSLPVIATYHAGIPSVIEHDVHGILVKEGDFKAIAQKILLLYSDRSLREKLGNNARIRATKELDVHLKSLALESLYDSLIDGP